MRVVLDNGTSIEIGATEATPTIGITDYSRRVTDDFGVTTVVERGFSRRLSVKLALPFASVSAVQQRLADLRATSALWVASERLGWLSVRGFYKDFDLDHAVPPVSYCTLTVEGLAETASVPDAGDDPSVVRKSTLRLLQPATIETANLVSSNVPENDAAEWSAQTAYPSGSRVIKAATHRIYESAIADNVGNDPAGASVQWIDVGPTKLWAMFDQALGTSTTAASSVAVTIDAPAIQAVALLDVTATNVRVQATGYDRTIAAGVGAITFLDLPAGISRVTVTTTGSNVAIGTLLVGKLVGLGITEASPTAGITDYSRKDVDDFGEVAIVQRAWAKRMTAKALIRTDAIDLVANRIAAVRARPSLWIGQAEIDSLTVYGFFKDFSIEVGENVSKLSLTIEGLSKAAPFAPKQIVLVPRGAYDPLTSYGEGDVVQYDGSSWQYINMAANSGNPPPAFPATQDGFWRIFASAGADGGDGVDGKNGIDGAPGLKGGDGRTSYVHFAYADSADGAVNFTTGTPGGRSYVGTYSDFSAADAATPATYVWSRYVGPAVFGLSVSGEAYLRGNIVAKYGNSGNWDTQAYSTEGWRGGCVTTFRLTDAGELIAGLNTDPTTDASYLSIDYAIYRIGSQCFAFENGENKGLLGPCDDTTRFSMEYTGSTVRYLAQGTSLREVVVAADQTFYFDSSIRTPGSRIVDIGFAARGSDGINGQDGAPGERGSDGLTRYVHYAYANAPDGSVDFAVGAPNGRAYVGTYSDFTAADSTNPASYVWAAYKGPAAFGLAARGDVALASNALVKTGTSTWGGGGGFSTEGWKGGAQTSFKLATTGTIAGLNTDPSTNDSFETIDYSFHCSVNGTSSIYESGAQVVVLPGGNDGSRTFQVVYDNATVSYYVNGGLVRQIAAAAGLTLYFDAAIAGNPGDKITDISFLAAGTAGQPGVNASTIDLSASAISFAAGYDGTVKAGQQPRTAQVRYLVGTADVTGSTAWEIPEAVNCSASITQAGALSITNVTGDGYVSVTGSYNGVRPQPKRVSFALNRDAAPPAGSTSLSQSVAQSIAQNATSYPAGVNTTALTVSANASGQLQAVFAISYYANYQQSSSSALIYNFTLAGVARYRVAGSGGAWSDFAGGAVGGTTSVGQGPDEPPSEATLSINQTQGGLSANVQYEVGIALRCSQNLRAQTADLTGALTVKQP